MRDKETRNKDFLNSWGQQQEKSSTVFFLAAEAEGTRNKVFLNSWGNAIRHRQEKNSTVFFLATEAEVTRKRLFLTA